MSNPIPQSVRDKIKAAFPDLARLCDSDDPRAVKTLARNATDRIIPDLTATETHQLGRVAHGQRWEG